MKHFMKTVCTPSTHDNARSYNQERPANYMRVSIVARPAKGNKSTTVLEDRGMQKTAGRASLVENEIEIDAVLDKR